MKKIYLIFTFFCTTLLFSQSSGNTCGQANIFCGATGITFANTTGAPSSGSLACLGTTPNASWFYLPISGNGTINLIITQTNNSGTGTDVDFAMYGPFTDSVTPCVDGLVPSNLVGCSYSAAPTENATITNAQAGQYYLMITTNYSNQAGNITITQTNLGAPGAGTISCSDLRLRLNAFLDLNSNGTREAGEENFPLGQFQYEVNNDGVTHNLTAPAGIYNIFETNPADSYDLSFTVDPQYTANYTASGVSYSNVFTGSLYNFPVTVSAPYTDLSITTIPFQSPRPGFIYENRIVYSNLGNQTIASGTVVFNKDANVSITSISQTGTTATATGFTYTFANLLPFETRIFSVFMQVPTIPTVSNGQILTNTSSLSVSGDSIIDNNSSTVSQVIVNSYDPNDKVESHGGKILHSSFTTNDYLYYTIRFENEGTASAINVKVDDILDAKLDETSLRMVSASHPYALDRTGNSLSWKFDNIQLPVSIANSSVGKGYISFKIKPKPNYSIGDIIPNSASIYFDFNPAIVTNTFTTEFVTALSTNQFEDANFAFYPNPVTDFITISTKNTSDLINKINVFDVLGKQVISNNPSGNNGTETVDLTSLNAGLYFIEVTTASNLKVVKKLIVR